MSARSGFALITVVLLMVGLGVLATALVFAAAQQTTVVGTLHDMARARLGAEAAVSIALSQWTAARRSLDPVGESVALVTAAPLDDAVTIDASSIRLDAETFLVAGSALVRRGGSAPIRRRAERLVRSIDADSIGRALDAALIAGRIVALPGAEVHGIAPIERPGSPLADPCTDQGAEGSAIRAAPDSVTISAGAAIDGSPAFAAEADAARFLNGFGHFGLAELRASALQVDDSVGSMVQDSPALRHAPGDLRLAGGSGGGVLLVDGDLVLEQGARFRGILIVLGKATIRDASVAGVVIASAVEISGTALLDRCAVADAFAAIDALRRPHPRVRSWLPTFD